MESSPGQELLGAFTSHGPSRGLYPPTRPSRTWRKTEAAGTAAPNPRVPVEGMRAAIPVVAGARTLLQPRVPAGGTEVVALESPAAVPDDGGRQRETQRTGPALPGARSKPKTRDTRRDSSGGREGNHSRFFSTTVATALAATRSSLNTGDHQPSGSAVMRADEPWSVSGSASNAGAAPSSKDGTGERTTTEISLTY